MTAKSELILEKARAHIGASMRKQIEMSPDTALVDLGVDSMGIITTLLMLEREVGLDFDRMIGLTPPRTLGDLVAMAVAALDGETVS